MDSSSLDGSGPGNTTEDWVLQGAPEVKSEFDGSVEAVESAKQAKALEYLENLDLLPMVIDLVEGVNSGRISAKDMHNAAGPIRAKLASAERYLKLFDDLDVSVEKRKQSIDLLAEKNTRKKKLLQRFQNVMEIKVDEIEAARRDSEIKNEQESSSQEGGHDIDIPQQTMKDSSAEDTMEIDT